jgi:glycine hydroxymethyltransferase
VQFDAIIEGDPHGQDQPFYLGMPDDQEGEALPEFAWEEEEVSEDDLKRTTLYDLHVELGGRMVPFAGWEMPVRYTSVLDEHNAVRKAAGLFDVTHMGVFQAEGEDAMAFLDSLCANDISSLRKGESLYTHFLDPDAHVIDDCLVYRRDEEKYLVVVNASNDAKDWAWFNAVRNGEVLIDRDRPWAKAFGRGVTLRDLRDPAEGEDQRVDLALQGPRSREILLELDFSEDDRRKITHLRWAELAEVSLREMDLIVARSGYTGEKVAFEIFVHPEKAPELFQMLLKLGKPYGLVPCGLGARDSLRTEAGLPLYGHELAGEMDISVGGAGFGSYVKTNKPWFIGRKAYLDREEERENAIARFRFSDKRVRKAHYGDPVMDEVGRVIGRVTSCATDSEGYFTGQAFINQRYAKKGNLVYIYQDVSKRKGKELTNLSYGERVALPDTATILRRFPRF